MKEPQFVSFSELPFRPLNERVSTRLIEGDQLMYVEHRAKKGHRAINDQHVSEQLSLVASGSLRVTIANKVYTLKPGDAIWIPSNVVHTVEVLEDSVVIEVFSPPRNEWLSQ